MAHRLLKLQLASAIRDAGWYAELEVAGEGWRADVLASSPDGTKRMAWEAQLAQITLDELRDRTARVEASGAGVLSHRPRPAVDRGVNKMKMPAGVTPMLSTTIVRFMAVYRELCRPSTTRCRSRSSPSAWAGRWIQF